MLGSTDQWITEGYQGITYQGVNTADNTWKKAITPSTWTYPAEATAWIAQFNTGTVTLNPNVNYYAQTLLQDSINQNAYSVDQNGLDAGDAIAIHLIAFDPAFPYDLSLVTDIWLHSDRAGIANPYGNQSLPFKVLSSKDLLVWLPNGQTWSQYWPTNVGGGYGYREINFEFDDSLGNWYTLNTTFNVFTGV
jgi:hypothetical protein